MLHAATEPGSWIEALPIHEQRRYCIIGGAGFIGSHFADRLMEDDRTEAVTVLDNFRTGRHRHLRKHLSGADPRFRMVHGDVHDRQKLMEAMEGHTLVLHLASNADIARAAIEPEIDFREGTELTQHILEAARACNVKRVLYASGSGVYGDAGEQILREEDGPRAPISTYGASKVAGEALIASYCAMFDMTACVFRFANVVGARQTHGVGYDFLQRLQHDPARLRVLGDGRQKKSYIHVSDVVEAVLHAESRSKQAYAIYNVATEDTITVTDIVGFASEALGLRPMIEYSGGDRGWKGDVPIVRLDCAKLRALGWAPRYNSRDAIRLSLEEMLRDEHVALV
ncbi:NAD-dependent epimerase/dehydratase family protein [Silvibacterium dinghuense]|uniref:NAD-dependent epimerase/dehydratase family protein n=1 Tax=Silvibacterium dinghuense TaxID=1560006 RepID=A0A4Q1SGQ6_9BACT|nr:NAD-dependent epimerase/dehydratase family protein [Silvibacterium dinghuense]RXS96694.1 NAD-dependent epimerase/dehydratase family protein [Silvibacterium dinghuense]GGG92927.1 UDP-glucose 4-epimerase [Silvibacterium dinghuense]